MALNVDIDPQGNLAYKSDGHVVITGPIGGQVTTADGTTYNVAPAVIEVASPEHAAEVARLIGLRYQAEGHPDHRDGTPFVFADSPNTEV